MIGRAVVRLGRSVGRRRQTSSRARAIDRSIVRSRDGVAIVHSSTREDDGFGRRRATAARGKDDDEDADATNRASTDDDAREGARGGETTRARDDARR